MSVAPNYTAGVTQVLVFSPYTKVKLLVHVFEPQPDLAVRG